MTAGLRLCLLFCFVNDFNIPFGSLFDIRVVVLINLVNPLNLLILLGDLALRHASAGEAGDLFVHL